MERKYKNVDELKKRVSELLKEGYLFSDIYEGRVCFIHSNEIQTVGCFVYYIVISQEKEYFIEEELPYYSSQHKLNENMCACRIFENYVFDILDFHIKYGIHTLYSYKTKPNAIRFGLKCGNIPYDIIMDKRDNNVQLSEEILGEIFFAREIIEDYARKSIYDILRECCEMP